MPLPRRTHTEVPPPPALSPWTFAPVGTPVADADTIDAANAGALALTTLRTPDERRRTLGLAAEDVAPRSTFTGTFSSWRGTRDSDGGLLASTDRVR